jgi:hypothetical protein
LPAVSQAQRGFLAAKFGPEWMRQHGFDNKGPLPMRVRKPGVKKPRVRAATGKIRSSHLGLNERHY